MTSLYSDDVIHSISLTHFPIFPFNVLTKSMVYGEICSAELDDIATYIFFFDFNLILRRLKNEGLFDAFSTSIFLFPDIESQAFFHHLLLFSTHTRSFLMNHFKKYWMIDRVSMTFFFLSWFSESLCVFFSLTPSLHPSFYSFSPPSWLKWNDSATNWVVQGSFISMCLSFLIGTRCYGLDGRAKWSWLLCGLWGKRKVLVTIEKLGENKALSWRHFLRIKSNWAKILILCCVRIARKLTKLESFRFLESKCRILAGTCLICGWVWKWREIVQKTLHYHEVLPKKSFKIELVWSFALSKTNFQQTLGLLIKVSRQK